MSTEDYLATKELNWENTLSEPAIIHIPHTIIGQVTKCIVSDSNIPDEKSTLLSIAIQQGYKSPHRDKIRPILKQPHRIEFHGRLNMDEDTFNFIAKHINDGDIMNEYILTYQSLGISIFRIMNFTEAISLEPFISPPIIIIAKPLSDYETKQLRNHYGSSNLPTICGLCNGIFSDVKTETSELVQHKLDKTTKWFRYKFKCNICNEVNRYENFLEEHVLLHVINKEIFCPSCSMQKIDESSNVDLNMSIKFNSFFYGTFINRSSSYPVIRCQHCKTTFAAGEQYFNKLLQIQTINRWKHAFKCCICQRTIGDRRKYAEEHILDHLLSKHVFCSECHSKGYDHLMQRGVANSASSDIRDVGTSFHEKVLSAHSLIRCRNCDKIYSKPLFILKNWVDLVEVNERFNRNNEKFYSYECKLCKYLKIDRKNMQEHVLNHVKHNDISCHYCRNITF